MRTALSSASGGRTTLERVLALLPKRFGKYGLNLHPTKTRLVPFSRTRKGAGGGGHSRGTMALGSYGIVGEPSGNGRLYPEGRHIASDFGCASVKERFCPASR